MAPSAPANRRSPRTRDIDRYAVLGAEDSPICHEEKRGPAAAPNVSMKIAVHRLRGKNGDESESIALRSVCRQLRVSGARGDGRRDHRA
jgi:hypothetical protein